MPKPGAERRFRRGSAAFRPPAAVVPVPVNLAVTHLTLSPRFALIWQSWRHAAGRLEQLQLETRRETVPGREPWVLWERSETLVERASRLFLARIMGGIAALRSDPPRSDTLNPVDRLRATPERQSMRHLRRSLRVETKGGRLEGRWPRSLWVRMPASRIAQRSIVCATARAQAVFERLRSRAVRSLNTTVVRRHLRILEGETVVRPGSGGAQRTADAVLVDGPPLLMPAVRGMRESPAARSMSPPEHRPTERVFRVEKPTAPEALPKKSVQTQPAPMPEAPQIDVAKLDTVLWQRFEKRLRIEQERRGRA